MKHVLLASLLLMMLVPSASAAKINREALDDLGGDDVGPIVFCPEYNPNAVLNACLSVGARWETRQISRPHPTVGSSDTCVIGNIGCLPVVHENWHGDDYPVLMPYVDGWVEPTGLRPIHVLSTP